MHCIFLKNHHSLKWDTLQFPPIYPSQRHNWPSSLEIIIFQNLEIFKIINISKKKTKISIFPENFQTHRGTTTEIKEPAASFPMNSKIFNHFQRTYKGRYTIWHKTYSGEIMLSIMALIIGSEGEILKNNCLCYRLAFYFSKCCHPLRRLWAIIETWSSQIIVSTKNTSNNTK